MCVEHAHQSNAIRHAAKANIHFTNGHSFIVLTLATGTLQTAGGEIYYCCFSMNISDGVEINKRSGNSVPCHFWQLIFFLSFSCNGCYTIGPLFSEGKCME